MAEKVLSPDKFHYKWNKDLQPAIEIDPGDVVTCETKEVTDGQVTPSRSKSSICGRRVGAGLESFPV